MFARVVQFTGGADVDAGVSYIRETVAPMMRRQKGFRGTSASADRANGVFGVLSLWDSEQDRAASEDELTEVREQAKKVIGGTMTLEHFEEVLIEAAGIPGVGSSLLLQRVSMDPASVDDNLAFFRQEILPEIKSQPGFVAVRQMINRSTGDAAVGSIWTDAEAMRAAAEAALARRARVAPRVTFGETSQREIVFVDMV